MLASHRFACAGSLRSSPKYWRQSARRPERGQKSPPNRSLRNPKRAPAGTRCLLLYGSLDANEARSRDPSELAWNCMGFRLRLAHNSRTANDRGHPRSQFEPRPEMHPRHDGLAPRPAKRPTSQLRGTRSEEQNCRAVTTRCDDGATPRVCQVLPQSQPEPPNLCGG